LPFESVLFISNNNITDIQFCAFFRISDRLE